MPVFYQVDHQWWKSHRFGMRDFTFAVTLTHIHIENDVVQYRRHQVSVLFSVSITEHASSREQQLTETVNNLQYSDVTMNNDDNNDALSERPRRCFAEGEQGAGQGGHSSASSYSSTCSGKGLLKGEPAESVTGKADDWVRDHVTMCSRDGRFSIGRF